ncbi:phage scaffolding protein [Paraclostridium sordellii]|uniref:phage scaffolding protein n=1 Tax=Paraclostridium sordellii TaxID=1505 RepID=UPI0005DDC928|nr:phage scaffolding protein [Paeniclostridium sordellii]CEN80993.1 scaffold protein [[Clostridium] sordellii] [Paeniclostridium sordellii]
MKLIEILKSQGLSDKQIDQITTVMRENNVYETSLENADEKYSKMKIKKEDFETQLKTATTTIEDLKKNNKANETLQKTIEEHEKTIEKLQQESIDKDFGYSLREALKEAGCIDSKALEVYLDKEKLKLEEGKISGLEEQLNPLKENKKYLFENTTPENTGGLGNFGRSNNNNLGGNNSQSSFMDAIKNNQLRK